MSAFAYHMREAIRLSREETDEIARLKAEVERLRKAVGMVGYRLHKLAEEAAIYELNSRDINEVLDMLRETTAAKEDAR